MKLEIKGIILKEVNYRENDKILTVLTDDRGIITVKARRCRMLKNTANAGLQMFSYGRFTLYESKVGYTVCESEIQEMFWDIRGDLMLLSLAGYFCELTLNLSPESNVCKDYLRLLLNSLFYLSNKKRNPLLIKSIFEMKSCSLCGYLPNLIACKICGVYKSGKILFDVKNAVMICEKCIKKCGYSDDGYALSEGIIFALRHIVYSPIDKLFSFEISDKAIKKISEICESYVKMHVSPDFNSLNFYNSLNLV